MNTNSNATVNVIEINARVSGGRGEDYDEGRVVDVIDSETVEVAWDSGVRTPAKVSTLERF